MLDGKKISAMLPKSWKKAFSKGIVIPAKKEGVIKVEVKCYVRHVIVKLAKLKNWKLL